MRYRVIGAGTQGGLANVWVNLSFRAGSDEEAVGKAREILQEEIDSFGWNCRVYRKHFFSKTLIARGKNIAGLELLRA